MIRCRWCKLPVSDDGQSHLTKGGPWKLCAYAEKYSSDYPMRFNEEPAFKKYGNKRATPYSEVNEVKDIMSTYEV